MQKQLANLDCKLVTNAQTGDIGYYSDNQWIPWGWDHYYPNYYTIYPSYTIVEDKVSKAFKVIQKMIEKKYIQDITIKQFIDIVSEVAAIL